LLGGRADKTLYLKADAGLTYGDVIDTMDRVRRAGVERLGMVTAPESPEDDNRHGDHRPRGSPGAPHWGDGA